MNQIKLKKVNLILLLGCWLWSVLILQSAPILGQNTAPNNEKKPKIKFLIMPVDESKQGRKTTFKVGEKILIKALVKNNTGEVFRPTIIYKYYSYQLDLRAIGGKRSKRHREDKIKSISANAMSPAFMSRLPGNPIENGRISLVDTLNLAEWYENIEPGEYKLTILYRPNSSDISFFSNPLIIKIVP